MVMALMAAFTTRIVPIISVMLMLMMLFVCLWPGGGSAGGMTGTRLGFLRAIRLAGMAAGACVMEFSVHRRPPWP
jgi:hypothetical protein